MDPLRLKTVINKNYQNLDLPHYDSQPSNYYSFVLLMWTILWVIVRVGVKKFKANL